jgi:hypothetical protein
MTATPPGFLPTHVRSVPSLTSVRQSG